VGKEGDFDDDGDDGHWDAGNMKTWLERYFKLRENGTTVRNELLGE